MFLISESNGYDNHIGDFVHVSVGAKLNDSEKGDKVQGLEL